MSEAQPYLIFGAPAVGDEELDEVIACVRSGWLGARPRVKRFEGDSAAYKRVDASLAAGLNSCTAALRGMSKDAGQYPAQGRYADMISLLVKFAGTSRFSTALPEHITSIAGNCTVLSGERDPR